MEMGHIPPKNVWGGMGIISPSARLSPSRSARMNLKLSGVLSNTVYFLPETVHSIYLLGYHNC